MSIEAKHKYRFGFLKSEKWQNFRLEALVNSSGKCFVCGDEHFSNDVHHIIYPDVWDETAMRHVAILCRDCHDKIHFLTDGREFESDGHKWKFFHAVTALLRDVAIKNWELKRATERKLEAQQIRDADRQREKILQKAIGCRGCGLIGDAIKKVNVLGRFSEEWIVNLCPLCEWGTLDLVAKMDSDEVNRHKKFMAVKKFWASKKRPLDTKTERL